MVLKILFEKKYCQITAEEKREMDVFPARLVTEVLCQQTKCITSLMDPWGYGHGAWVCIVILSCISSGMSVGLCVRTEGVRTVWDNPREVTLRPVRCNNFSWMFEEWRSSGSVSGVMNNRPATAAWERLNYMSGFEEEPSPLSRSDRYTPGVRPGCSSCKNVPPRVSSVSSDCPSTCPRSHLEVTGSHRSPKTHH